MRRERIVVAMSGGVDSSVAAAFLVDAGYEVLGITMQLWPKAWCDAPPTPKSCCSMRDAEDARSVASCLDIPLYVIDLVEEFQRGVIDYFTQSYARGRTPNPCIACNDHIKFGALLHQAELLGATRVATGHYARLQSDATTQRQFLMRGTETAKDQSYVLFGLRPWQLARTLFPIGTCTKSQVRQEARARGLVTAEKLESQDICFLRGGHKDAFLADRLPETPGDIVDVTGRVLGAHRGAWRFTIGQREGLGVSAAHRLYVLRVDTERNQVVVGPREALTQQTCAVNRINWMAIQPRPGDQLEATVQLRAHHTPVPATVTVQEDDCASIIFHAPTRDVTPGQAAVWYRDDVVLGGGWICKEAPVACAQA